MFSGSTIDEGWPGEPAWRVLLEAVANPNARERELFGAFDRFLNEINNIDKRRTEKEAGLRLHLAPADRLAARRGCGKPHRRPELRLLAGHPRSHAEWANGQITGIGSTAGAVLLAAIIEIALLNSTHVIALHSCNSAGSKWIPYELCRAKARRIFSSQAAGWFEQGVLLTDCGEYVHLAHQTHSDQDIEDWLMKRGQYA
jgi:hypothetical protein